MKLVFAQLAALRQYVSREFFYVLTGLIEEHGWRHIEPYELWQAPGTLRDKLLKELGELPEVVLFWESYEFLNSHSLLFDLLGCRKYVFADDLHWWDDEMRDMKTQSYSSCEGILCTYEPAFRRLYPRLARKKEVSWIPHAASPDFLLEYNERPEVAIFLSGAINKHYPLRQEMLRLQERGDHAIVYHEHPGYHCSYEYGRDANVGRSYAERIRHHLVGFTDCLTFRYTVAKHFEIPATGALLLADGAVEEDLARLGFEAGVHYLPVSAEDLEERVAHALDERNRGEVDAIRRRGQELVRARHTTVHRTRRIDEVCR